MDQVVSIIGLGYVGLPLALQASKSGYRVNGIDTNSEVVALINSGISTIEDIDNFEISSCIESGKFNASIDFSSVSDSGVVIVCVPTPLNNQRQPDLSYLESAVTSLAQFFNPDSLLIIESTVAPGTTRGYVLPIIKKCIKSHKSQLKIAFSPERIDPSNKVWNLINTPKIVAGLDDVSLSEAVNFYSKFIDNVVACKSVEVAEIAKLLENSFRLVNISLINELSIFCYKSGVDINEVIRMASTKPYGFMPFYPSVGVGGHCIPVDPLYLSNKARELDAPSRFIDLADQINQEMPSYFVGRAEEKLSGLKNKNILVVGVAYKPNVADVRETPVAALISGLRNKGAQVSWHDDLVEEWNGEKSVDLKPGFDLAIIATPHSYLDLKKLGDTLVLDTRGSIK
jgi:UDP-N-acetyl-D-glucosamine dehydrogenase